MKPSDSSDPDRLLELLADQALAGLGPDQQRELEWLLQGNPDFDIAAMDRTAAMLDIAASAGDLEPLPGHLRDRILTREQSELAPLATLAVATRVPDRIHWRERVAWMAAAACLLFAVLAWSRWPASDPASGPNINPPSAAGNNPSPTRIRQPDDAQRRPATTIAEMREQLLVSADDVLHLQLVSNDDAEKAGVPGGDIVWSSRQQMGYLRLQGLANNEPEQRQYQLWIVGGDSSSNEFINGGTFFVDRNTGELTVPIQADHFVQTPRMFLVSVEPLGGGDALTASLLAKADGSRP